MTEHFPLITEVPKIGRGGILCCFLYQTFVSDLLVRLSPAEDASPAERAHSPGRSQPPPPHFGCFCAKGSRVQISVEREESLTQEYRDRKIGACFFGQNV